MFFSLLSLFFFNDTATTEIYTLSLHDALPIFLESFPGTVSEFGEEKGNKKGKSNLPQKVVDVAEGDDKSQDSSETDTGAK